MRLAAFEGLSMVLVLALAPAARAQRQDAEIPGVVRDSTGEVIAGATVTLRQAGGAFVASMTTDARGRYTFPRIAAGGYTLLIHKDGFAAVDEELRVEGGPTTRDVALPVAGFSEEVTVSFTGEQAGTALKIEAPVRDIPLSVKSYTSSFIKALDVKEAGDLYTYMNGINRTGGGVSDASIRGFTSGSDPFNFQTNGLPGFTVRRASPNLASVERIEVLKGPAAVLYGRVAPGGLVNFVTKRPLYQPQYLLDLRYEAVDTHFEELRLAGPPKGSRTDTASVRRWASCTSPTACGRFTAASRTRSCPRPTSRPRTRWTTVTSTRSAGDSSRPGSRRSSAEDGPRPRWPSSTSRRTTWSLRTASITENTRPERLGALLNNAARHSFNGWGRYNVSSGVARGLGFGVGVLWRGARAGSLPEQQTAQGTAAAGVLVLPRYWRVDTGLYFVRSRYEVTLRVSNLLDELYYESSAGLVQLRPGRPRDVALSCACGCKPSSGRIA